MSSVELMDEVTVDAGEVAQRFEARAAQDFTQKVREIATLETYVAVLTREIERLKRRNEELEQLSDA